MSDGLNEQLNLAVAEVSPKYLDSVEKYEFEPIKGYPMLNWRGKRPFTSTQYYPAQLKEVHGEEVDGWRNKIFWGDNLQVMSHLLKKFRGEVDLIYIDPPFDSKADYKKTVEIKGNQAETSATSFEEKQYSDIWTNDEYLQFMYERLVMAREFLSPSGALYLHCDPRKSPHLRLILDEVFGSQNFRNEIIWHYKFRMMDSDNQFNRKHDNIFFYARSPETRIKMPKEAWVKEDLIKTRKQEIHIGDDGREMIWMPGQKGNSKSRMVPLDEILARGKAVDDVWDMPIISSSAKERTGYPTQKPEALIERIIAASSPAGGLVLDFFMGSGTTQAVAMKLGRRFIGADINLGAIQTTAKRLIGIAEDLRQKPLGDKTKPFTGFEVYNVNHYDIFRNPVQAKELLIEALEIQKLEFSTIFDGEKDGRMVKIMPVNRIATCADLNELIAGFDYKAWERKQNESPKRPVEKITLVCMGHESDLAAQLVLAAKPFNIHVEVVDILRDKADLEFRRDSQAKVAIKNGELVIERFYPMNLLQKLSLQKESVEDWKELVESVLIDWNYDGAVLQPTVVDIPGKNELVKGEYLVPCDAGTIRVKIMDLLSESWEGSISHGD
ncbi:site-specific DNA-methyltransferase [Pollutimonas subterranea]|uniref:Site-specific DNA-methyltransferase n=1 Tax=Pollutimonas subterranea TaxID=2045210 RepID=A0A2N4TZ38_9BURK|nr:site-specific DNA-methyltransferase [Pollutimonas subterranea]PLC48031.1 site-specific DNA-methyltransferase [Pollutimonas subterranea]